LAPKGVKLAKDLLRRSRVPEKKKNPFKQVASSPSLFQNKKNKKKKEKKGEKKRDFHETYPKTLSHLAKFHTE
jgi:hypothetical protein